jgi:hypothetical protein
METPSRTDKQQLADLLLGQPVEDWVAARRPGLSWERIAVELRDATDRRVEVSGNQLRLWMLDRLDETTEASA